MKLKLICAALFLFAFVSGANAKDEMSMSPPKPLQNSALNSMVGTWTGESDMMGTKMRDKVKVSWALNHQYIMMQLESVAVDNPKIRYQGIGMFGADESGNAKTWWFDNWGANAASTGTGTAIGNKLEMNDSNAMFNETRSFVMSGNEMKMSAKGSMKMNGKDTPFNQSVVYTRTKD